MLALRGQRHPGPLDGLRRRVSRSRSRAASSSASPRTSTLVSCCVSRTSRARETRPTGASSASSVASASGADEAGDSISFLTPAPERRAPKVTEMIFRCGGREVTIADGEGLAWGNCGRPRARPMVPPSSSGPTKNHHDSDSAVDPGPSRARMANAGTLGAVRGADAHGSRWGP